MKFFALLCIVGFAAASTVGHSKVQWQDDHEYTFNYEGRLLTGIPELQSQYSGLGMKCNVHLKVQREGGNTRRFTLRITEPQYVRVNHLLQPKDQSQAQRNWRNLQLPAFQQVPEDAKRMLNQPTSFDLEFSGKFESMTVDQNEAEWSVNFKKAIVILFQTQFKNMDVSGVQSNMISEDQTSMLTWTTSEEGLDGVCQVDYQVNEIPKRKAEQLREFYTEECRNSGERRYEIVKTKNVNSCSQRNSFSFYKPGFFRCPNGNCEGMWTRSSITRYFACGSNIESMKIQSIVNEGELEQDLFGERTEKFLTGNSQVLKLTEKRSVSSHDSISSDAVTIRSPSFVYNSKKQGLSGQQQGAQLEADSIFPRHMIASGSPSQRTGGFNSQVVMNQIKKIVEELVKNDLPKPVGLPQKEVTLKAISLARAFSLLNRGEMEQVYTELKHNVGSSSEDTQTMKNIVFDTIMMGGTKECVLFIKENIQKKELTTAQQMTFFMMMPHYMVTPTEYVLEQIYQLVKSQQVRENPIVYNQAILSYSALIQRACISENRHSSYPTWVMGEFCSPQSQIVQNKWIPYLQSQIYQNQHESSSVEWRNLHLVSLGLMKHQAVLPTLLQFIEQREQHQESSEASDAERLTRFLAVYSLSNAGFVQPQKTVQTLHSIVKNQSERPEIRIAAFNALLKMNPELYVLQSIASMTWREENQEVKNVINSAFFTLAHQKDIPVLEVNGSNLRRKATLVLPLLKWSRSLSSMTGYIADRLPMLDDSYRQIWSWTSTKANSGSLPTDYYSRMVYLLNRYQFTACEAAVRLEGLDNLAQQVVEAVMPGSHKSKKQVGQKIIEQFSSEWRQVIEKLNIKNRDNQGSQSAIFVKVFEDTPIFYSLQSSTSEMLKEKLNQLISSSSSSSLMGGQICGEHKVNFQRFLDLSPAEYLIPSEMGFPILVEVHSPQVASVKGQINIQCGQSIIPDGVTMDVKTLYASQYVGFVGTICPFTNEVVLTSVDEHTTVNLPTRINMKYNKHEQRIQVQLTPIKELNQQVELIHHHVQPYTVNQGLYNFEPVTRSPNMKLIRSEEKQWTENFDLDRYIGLGIQGQVKSESRFDSIATVYRQFQMYDYSLYNLLNFRYASTAVSERGYPSLRNHLVQVTYNPAQSTVKEIDISLKYGFGSKTQGKPIQYDMVKVGEEIFGQEWPLTYPSWQKLLPVAIESKPAGQWSQHQTRQQQVKQILEETNVETGRAIVLDGSISLKGSSRPSIVNYHLQLATGFDQLKEKWNVKLSNAHNQKQYCVQGHLTPQGQLASMDIEEIRNNPVTLDFENVIGYGSSCTESTVKFTGTVKTSEEQIRYSRESNEAKQYNELKSKNSTLAKLSKIASVVREQASYLDHVTLQVEANNAPKVKHTYNYLAVSYLKAIMWPYTLDKNTTPYPQDHSEGNFKNLWTMKFFSKTNTVNVHLKTNQEAIKMEAVQLPYWAPYFAPANGLSRVQFLKGQSSPSMRLHSKCDISGDLLSTFEKKLIPHKIDDCFHVVAADCSFKKSFAVLARSTEGQNPKGPKEVKIISGYTNILVTPSSSSYNYGSSSGLVKVNGSEISLPTSTMTPKYVKDNKGDLIATIFKTKEGGIEVSTVVDTLTKNNALTVKVINNFVQVLVDSTYRSQVCGTCGEMSGDKLNSLRGPKKCLFSKPQLLVASYRVSTQEKQCGSLEQTIKQELRQEQEQCHKSLLNIPSQVEKSYQVAGGKCTRHVHLVVERPEQICLSKRPVPQCGSTCRPESETSKSVSYTCFPSSSRVGQLYREKALKGETIEQLSGMKTDFRTQMELPRTCVSYGQQGW